MKRDATKPWSVPVVIHEVPATGRHFDLAADAGTREAVAKSIGVAALPRLQASFDVTRRGSDGLRVVGRVSATVGQICVVTLDPIENDVDEPVDLAFVVPADGNAGDDGKVAVHVAEDAPEPLIGGVVDLGVIATDFLSLGLDPYPRKPGAEFAAPVTEDDSGHPFAALAALKNKPERT
jgi:hypothetical protein